MTDGNIRKQHPQPCRLRVFCSSMYHSIVKPEVLEESAETRIQTKQKTWCTLKCQEYRR